MLTSMAIESPCPGCGVVLEVPDEHAGKQARCPECSALFVVPQRQAAVAIADSIDAKRDDAAAAPAAPMEPELPVAEAPPPDHRQWWLKTPQGAIYGPISKEQLDNWCEEGRIADDCQVKHEEEHAWRNADIEYPLLSAAAASSMPPPVAEWNTARPNVELHPRIILPHRGVIVLALGVASWITLLCPVFGVIAWNMGNRDLELMYAGQMDASGMRITHLGRLLGLIHVLTFVTVVILGLGFTVIYLVMQ